MYLWILPMMIRLTCLEEIARLTASINYLEESE